MEAGTVLKFRGSGGIDVDATVRLTCNGTTSSPVVMTTLDDDSILGDSNRNGAATAPSPGDRAGLRFQDDLSVLDGVRVRFAGGQPAGNPGAAAVRLSGADILILGTTIENSPGPCLDLFGNSFPVLTLNQFRDSLKAVVNVPIRALPNFTASSASGNQLGNYIEVTNGQVDAPATIAPGNGLNGGQESGGGSAVFVVAAISSSPPARPSTSRRAWC